MEMELDDNYDERVEEIALELEESGREVSLTMSPSKLIKEELIEREETSRESRKVEIIGMVNLRIQKTPKASAMVVHVDKVKLCKGETPESWIGRQEERLIDKIERGAFITLFDDSGRNRDSEINEIENNVEKKEKKVRPKRNAPVPARYIQQIYAVGNHDNVDVCCRDDF